MGNVSRWQSRHDKAWKKLVDSKVLEPFETEELLWDFTHVIKLQGEGSEAQKAASSATLTVNLADQALQKAQRAGLSRQSLSQVEQKLSIARSKLAAATKSLEQISIQRKLIHKFKSQMKSYSIAKDNASDQSILLQWILQQVPLIELELNSAEVIKDDLARGNGRHQRSLKRSRDDRNEEPGSKRQRQNDENHTLSKSKIRPSTIQETSSAQRPRQLGSSQTNPSTLASKPCSQRALGASRLSNTRPDSAKSGVVLDDSV